MSKPIFFNDKFPLFLWLLIIYCLLFSAIGFAQENTDPESEPEADASKSWLNTLLFGVFQPLETEVEFGYQSHAGNTDTRSINTRLKTEYISGRHRTQGEWKYYNLYKDNDEDKRQSTYSIQSDYKLSPKAYLYGSFKGFSSKYSAYFKDYTLSFGPGYQYSNTEVFVLELEAGPGYRYQEPNLDEIDDDDIVFPEIVREAIFRSNLNMRWQALDNLRISAEFTFTHGKSNSSIDSDISIMNNITKNIAIKVTQSRQYHDRVPEGVSKHDSTLSVNLLFLF